MMDEFSPQDLAAAQADVGRLEDLRDHCLEQLRQNPTYEIPPSLQGPLERLLSRVLEHHATEEGSSVLGDSPELLVSLQGSSAGGLPALIDLTTSFMAEKYGDRLAVNPAPIRRSGGGPLETPTQDDPNRHPYFPLKSTRDRGSLGPAPYVG